MAADTERQDDLAAHTKGYSLFTGLMKWGTIASLATAAIVVLIIGS